MKKTILSFCFVLLALFNYAQQVPRELVLVEIGTGTWCTYCPGAAMAADDLHANGDPVALIENHNGDNFDNTYSNYRNDTYYHITGFPTGWFDGRNPVVGGSHSQTMYPQYIAKVNSRMTVPTSFLLDISGNNEGDVYNINIEIQKVADYQEENIVVHLALTESDIQFNWQGMSECNFVNRLMVPNQMGTAITMATGETLTVPLTFTFNNSWVKDNCELIAWVQNNTTKEVMHCAKIMVNDLAIPMMADFAADVTTGCGPTPVQFQNMSTGENLTYTWIFPGGTPEFSYDENPLINFNTEGQFDVSLTITNGVETTMVTKENFIRINPDVNATFGTVPDLCFEDGTPYQLTQGSPAGGVYSGVGVVDGYFDPLTSGVGSFPVTYTYTDPDFGCVAEATQTVVVDACLGVNEQVNGVELSILPNPTTGKFVINMSSATAKDVKVRVVNSLGKVVIDNVNINVMGSAQQEINLSGLARGIYFVQLESNGKSFNKKILVRD
ncbi:MAG: T9SS type A sorting domain-containing protein [Bacteroidales bacterium]|nr:T9SS type A sorting domain-containing protein [Bacteroidales bacterium]